MENTKEQTKKTKVKVRVGYITEFGPRNTILDFDELLGFSKKFTIINQETINI